MIYGFYPTSCMCVSYKRTYFLSHVFYAFYQTVYKIFIVVSPTPHLPNIKLFKQTYHFQTFLSIYEKRDYKTALNALQL